MMYGVKINDFNTLHRFGLILCAELSVSSPEPKTSYITLPEADGDLDLTGALSGGTVRYGMRKISFELFAAHDIVAGTDRPATEEHLNIVRQMLFEAVHGKKCKLWLPDDSEHYFIGRIAVGGRGGFNSGIIPMDMTAEPWRYKNAETTKTVTESGNIVFINATKPAVPTFTVSDSVATVTLNGVSHQLTAGTNKFEDMILQPGSNTIRFANVSGAITVRYQEAVL